MTSERRYLAETLIDLTAMPGSLFYRNNTGQAWNGNRVEGRPGTLVRIEQDMVILRHARPIKFGLEGSGDIIGAASGRPVAVETKTEKGRQRVSQEIFERQWVRAGGIYVLARPGESARAKVEAALLIS